MRNGEGRTRASGAESGRVASARLGHAHGSRTAVSLRQIAGETGLAVATVSRILRGTDECLPETRRRVRAVAERLGYRPNLLVHALKTGRSNTIGAMVYVGNEFDAYILKGIHEALLEEDCLPLLACVTAGADALARGNEREQIHRLIDRRVDGIILYPREDTVEDCYLSEVWERGIPLVTVDHELPRTHADFVGTDDVAGGRLAAEHLLALGHRLLGHLAGPAELTPGLRRRQGFESAVSACPGAACVTLEDSTFGWNAEALVHDLLTRQPRPTAIFCANDTQARVVYRVAAERGLAIPHDLSVVGFADLSFARDLTPPLTTLRQDPAQIGRLAARFVLDRRDGRWTDAAPRKEMLMPELIVRGSSAAVSPALEVLPREGLAVKRQDCGVRVAGRPANLPVAIYSELDLLHPRTSYFYRQVSRALREFFDRAGVASAFYMGRTQPGECPEGPTCPNFLNDLAAGRFTGVAFGNTGDTEGWGQWVARFPLPAVGTWFKHSAGTDNDAMIAAGVRALAEQGCRRPALLAWGCANVVPTFRAAVEAHGLHWSPDRVRGDLHPQLSGAGWEEFREIWCARSGRPDGLLVCDDMLFDDAKTAILSMGIDVPRELRIVTHANKGAGVLYPFPVTLLEVDPDAAAAALGGMLLRLLMREPVAPATVLLPFHIRQAGRGYESAANNARARRDTAVARTQKPLAVTI